MYPVYARKIAHRGYTGKGAPANSIAAFKEAISEGFDILELDLHLCADHHIIIFHDRHINGVPVESLSSNRVKQLFPETATLLELFTDITDIRNVQLYFDLKGRDELGRVLWRFLIQNNISTHNLMAGSFNVNHLSALQGSGVRLGLITCSKHTITQYYDLLCDLYFMSIDKSILDKDVVAVCRGLGKKIFVFTCTDTHDETYIRSFDVDGIVSDILLIT